MRKPVEWYSSEDGMEHTGADAGGVSIAKVRFAKPGDIEGGLGALARFLSPAAARVPLSPGGWYWQGTVTMRGVWTRPAGPFDTAQEAIDAANAAPWTLTY